MKQKTLRVYILGVFFMPFSVHIFMPFRRRRSAVTPLPSLFLPEKVPSHIFPWPQEGLPDFIIACCAPASLAILSVSRAPFKKFPVTSVPSFSITLAFPSNTSVPVPPDISAGSLGVVSPPNCSGQTGIAFPSSTSRRTSGSALFPPLYLQLIPARHALTIIIIANHPFCLL